MSQFQHPESTGVQRIPVLRFAGGAIAGALLLAVPLTYSDFLPNSPLAVGLEFGLCLLCGALSLKWGESFVDRLMQLLDSSGL